MLTFTNANPITDAQICQSKAISATSKGFDWRSVDPSTALKSFVLLSTWGLFHKAGSDTYV